MTVDRLSQAARRQQRSPAGTAGASTSGKTRTSAARAASPLPTPGSPNRRYGAWRPSATYWPERVRVR